MIRKLVFLLITVPLAVVLIALSVANRQSVKLHLNPFEDIDSIAHFNWSIELPFFAYLFLAMLLGLLFGSFLTWWRQGKHRRWARESQIEANKWQGEAEKQQKRAEELAEVATPETTYPMLGLPSSSKPA